MDYVDAAQETQMNDFARQLAQLENGPIKRSGQSILGYESAIELEESFSPAFVPPEISSDEWMLKCAISSADFNRRLINNRPTSFLDLHTNIEQIRSISQPTRVLVECAEGNQMDFKCIQEELNVKNSRKSKKSNNGLKTDRIESKKVSNVSDENDMWKVAYDSTESSRFPLALLPNQYQNIIALYNTS